MLGGVHIDVVISSDVRRSVIKIVTHKFNLVILRLPSLWKEDGVLLGAHSVFVDSHSAELSGLYFIESQPLETCCLYVLFPFELDRDLTVRRGHRFAGALLTRTRAINAWGFHTFEMEEQCADTTPSPASDDTAFEVCNPGPQSCASSPSCPTQPDADCPALSALSALSGTSCPAQSVATPVQSGGSYCPVPPDAGNANKDPNNKATILQCIKEACEEIEACSLEGLGTLDEYADLVICAREAHDAQNAACAAWASELAEMSECAVSIDGAIGKLQNELQLPAQKDYTGVLEGMKSVAEGILSIKIKMNNFDDAPKHFETLREFRSTSSDYERL